MREGFIVGDICDKKLFKGLPRVNQISSWSFTYNWVTYMVGQINLENDVEYTVKKMTDIIKLVVKSK